MICWEFVYFPGLLTIFLLKLTSYGQELKFLVTFQDHEYTASKKLGVQDALAYRIDGNDSDLEDFSSDDDDDADDNFLIESQAVGDSSEGKSEDGSEHVQAAEASAAQGISGAAMNNGSPSKEHVY